MTAPHIASTATESAAVERQALGHLDLGGRRILVVEDDAIVAQVIMSVLREIGCAVAGPVTNAAGVWESVNDFPPDLVLMDIGIEGEQDGIDTATMLREQFDVPVVFLTGATEPDVVERARRVQPLGYLVKPIKPVTLRSAVEMAFWRDAAERRIRAHARWVDAVLNTVDVGVVTADADGAITHLNRDAERLLGRRFAAVEGSRLVDLVRLSDEHHRPLDVRFAMDVWREATLHPIDGEPRTVRCKVTDLVDGADVGASRARLGTTILLQAVR